MADPCWTFDISTGRLWSGPTTEAPFAFGWTGHDVLDVYPPKLARCNPDFINAKGVGPIPPGLYDMTEMRAIDGACGPNVIVLRARPEVELFGRDGTSFRIHGRAVATPWLSSDGCVILPADIRLRIWASPVHLLSVAKEAS